MRQSFCFCFSYLKMKERRGSGTPNLVPTGQILTQGSGCPHESSQTPEGFRPDGTGLRGERREVVKLRYVSGVCGDLKRSTFKRSFRERLRCTSSVEQRPGWWRLGVVRTPQVLTRRGGLETREEGLPRHRFLPLSGGPLGTGGEGRGVVKVCVKVK